MKIALTLVINSFHIYSPLLFNDNRDPVADFRPRDLKAQPIAKHAPILGTTVAVESERSARTIPLDPMTAAFASSACLVMSAMPALANLLHALRGPSMTGPSHNVSPALLDRTKMSEEALTANPVLQDQLLKLKEQ
jgi:hypothetical protein